MAGWARIEIGGGGDQGATFASNMLRVIHRVEYGEQE